MRLLKFSIITLIFINLWYPAGVAQFYSAGQDPASIKWSQINTEYFQIIFPSECEGDAQYLANVLEQVYDEVNKDLNAPKKKVSVILHNQSVLSNGISAWAPKRIDLSITPPQDNYVMNWLDQLAIHELRHVIQIERINVGITKLLGVLMGEMAVGGAAGTFLPQWYFEGDATDIETRMGGIQGRGKVPEFEMRMKAQLLGDGINSYEKATHGSIRDYVPSEYHLGYLLTSEMRERTGINFWEKAIDESGKQPFAVTPFSNSIKKSVGWSKQQMYEEVMEKYRFKWEKEIREKDVIKDEFITKHIEYYTNYRQITEYEDGKVLAFKRSYDDVKRIIAIDLEGNEEIIFTPGPGLDQSLSYGDGKICWAEYQIDARWDHRDYSVIKIYDVKSKKLTNLTNKSRYFAPEISKDGKHIVCVEITTDSKEILVILNAENGEVQHRYEAVNGMHFMTPCWNESGNAIALIVQDAGGQKLGVYSPSDQNLHLFLPESQYQIKNPKWQEGQIYYTASYDGTDNIYALDLNTKGVKKLTEVVYGATDALMMDDHLVSSSYYHNGYRIKKAKKEDLLNENVELNPLQASIDTSKFKLKKPIKKYPVEKYHEKLFRFHSWAPFSLDPYEYSIKPGVSVFSQNLLSTATTVAGYEHNFREDVGRWYVDFSYEGWYPIIDVDFEHAKRRRYYLSDTVNHVVSDFTFKETTFQAGLRIPIRLNRNKHIQGIQPWASFENIWLKMHPDSPFEFKDGNIQAVHYGISLYHQIIRSRLDIYPRWGQVIQFAYSMTPFKTDRWVGLTTIESFWYFPGLAKHHGIRIYAAYQHRRDGVYGFPNRINHVRGQINMNDVDQYRASIDYKFALAYPDWALGSFTYVKKLDLGLFYDYGYGKSPDLIRHYHTIGTDLHLEFHLLSFVAPIDLTFRNMYYPDMKSFGFEVMVNIDFSRLY